MNYQILENNALIGALGDGAAYPFVGYLDNVRVISGFPLYTTDFTPPDVPLDIYPPPEE
jgi:hypothetical protein